MSQETTVPLCSQQQKSSKTPNGQGCMGTPFESSLELPRLNKHPSFILHYPVSLSTVECSPPLLFLFLWKTVESSFIHTDTTAAF